MSPRAHMDIAEFRALGYLQELNRLFLHPLGLALEVVGSFDGTETLGGIWDSRDDPEGIVFSDAPDVEKVVFVRDQLEARSAARFAGLGFVIQPEDAS